MRQRALSWLCATTALLALLSSCSKSKSAGESDNKAPAKPGSAEPAGAAPAAAGAIKLSVAAIPIVDVAPIYLGKAKGFFSEQNLDLTIQSVRGGAEAVPERRKRKKKKLLRSEKKPSRSRNAPAPSPLRSLQKKNAWPVVHPPAEARRPDPSFRFPPCYSGSRRGEARPGSRRRSCVSRSFPLGRSRGGDPQKPPGRVLA